MMDPSHEIWRCKLNGRAPRVYFLPVGDMRFVSGVITRKIRPTPPVGWGGYLLGLVVRAEPRRSRISTTLTISDDKMVVYDLGVGTTFDAGVNIQRLGPYSILPDYRIDLCFDQEYYEDVEVVLTMH